MIVVQVRELFIAPVKAQLVVVNLNFVSKIVVHFNESLSIFYIKLKNIPMKFIPQCIIFLVFFHTKLYSQFSLEMTNEFFVNSLNTINIVDFNSSKNIYLGYEKVGLDYIVVLIDKDGQKIRKKNLEGQGPCKFNSAMNFLGFSDTGDIWVITPNNLLIYDDNLIFKENKKFIINNPFFTSFLTESPIFFYKKNSKSNLNFVTYPSGTRKFMRKESLEKEYLLEIFDLNNQKSYSLAPISDRFIYKNLDKSVFTLYSPLFAHDKKRDIIFVTATLDNEITVIDLQSEKTISNILINHGEFSSLKKSPISLKNLPSYNNINLASNNRKILYLDGGLIVLDYLLEMSPSKYEMKKAEDKFYLRSNDPDYHRLIIFDQNKQLSGDLKIPYGEIQIALPNNSILIKLINPDKEEDFIRYGVFKVVNK